MSWSGGRTREHTGRYCRVVRAKIVMMAAGGVANSEIAARLDTSPQVVWRWRKRFFEGRLEGLEDHPRSGRPPVFSPSVVTEAKQLACELPSVRGISTRRVGNFSKQDWGELRELGQEPAWTPPFGAKGRRKASFQPGWKPMPPDRWCRL